MRVGRLDRRTLMAEALMATNISSREVNPDQPYLGARAFGEDDTIYGRAVEIREVRNLLLSARVVLLHAPSGAGKTSLIRAGIVPMAKENRLVVVSGLRLEDPGLQVTDGNPYLMALANSLGYSPSDPL